MKLLYITNGINGPGGLERVLSVKASMLAEQYGYKVAVLVLNSGDKNPFYSFSNQIIFYDIPATGSPIRYFLSYRKGIQKTVNQFQPDIISVCDDGLKGFFLPRLIKTSAKWIYERHVSKQIESNEKDNLIKKTITKVKWQLMEMLAQKFEYFVLLTEGNKDEWQKLNNIKVIPNPLSFISNEKSSLENKTVLCVGKVSYQKGQDLLLKAWERVYQKFPDWQLYLFGKENLDFLDTRNLENNVSFFPPEKNIRQKYIESSVYVMSSRFEGFGMVLTEAMECGVPCVSFDCPSGPADIIKDGEDGFLVEKENADKLAEKLITLIENQELRKKMGAKAKENVKRFSAETILQKWDKLFKELSQ